MGLKLAFIMMVLMGAMGGLGYWYYNDTQEKMAILVANEAKATLAVKEAEAAKEAMKESYEAMAKENALINSKFSEIEDAKKRLENKLAKHDIGVYGIAKPTLTEKTITNTTKDQIRCLEIVSGAELTVEEKSASKPSEINTECFEQANPNFDPDLYPVWKEKNQ
jgi:hypothetical protein